MSIVDRFRKRNEKFARDFDKGDAPMPPAERFVVLTCMDARLHPETFLGMEIGDAHVIRNAGGRASDDALRSLIISSRLLGTQEYAVIHHTDCGMLTFSNDELRGKLAADTGRDASHMDFLPFSDLEESVRDDVRRIRDNPFVPPDIEVSGWVYDVKTGKLQEIVPAGR
ncbi:MAG TPA: carbonic anhydrase [Actinomycetota bacterium]|jgi:carbonic anhydrase